MHAASAVALLLGAAAAAAGQDAAAVLKRVDGHYDRLHTLRARYVEHYTGMGMDRTEAGTLLLARPGRMRWDYDAPVGKVFVLDGKYAWSYTPGDAQVQRVAAKKLDDLRSPLRFLLGQTHLAKELMGIRVVAIEGGHRITGVPRGMEARFRELALQVDEAGAIRMLRLEELDGAATEFTFSDLREEAAIAAKAFTFAAPPGVSVVEGLPPI